MHNLSQVGPRDVKFPLTECDWWQFMMMQFLKVSLTSDIQFCMITFLRHKEEVNTPVTCTCSLTEQNDCETECIITSFQSGKCLSSVNHHFAWVDLERTIASRRNRNFFSWLRYFNWAKRFQTQASCNDANKEPFRSIQKTDLLYW